MTRRGHIAVAGAGSWGTAVASLLSRNHIPTILWARRAELADEINATHRNSAYLPGIDLPSTLRATADPQHALGRSSVVILGIPSHGLRERLTEMGPLIPSDAIVVSLTKGVELETLMRMSEVISEAAGVEPDRVGVLSGPNLAKEVARGLPGASVLAFADLDRAERLQRIIHCRTFRVYTNPDVCGVEIGGAAKNVIAIAAGIADGMGYGDNAKAAIVTRGLFEVTRIGTRLGAHPMTFMGLAGIGDLVVTCFSRQSRNRHVGEELGKGRKLDDIISEMNMVAEGVKSSRAILALGEKVDADMPVCSRVVRVLFEGAGPEEMMVELMTRAPEPEFLGIPI